MKSKVQRGCIVASSVVVSDKAKLFPKSFSYHDNVGMTLPAFLPTTNLKLHNISVTPELVEKGHNQPRIFKTSYYSSCNSD